MAKAFDALVVCFTFRLYARGRGVDCLPLSTHSQEARLTQPQNHFSGVSIDYNGVFDKYSPVALDPTIYGFAERIGYYRDRTLPQQQR